MKWHRRDCPTLPLQAHYLNHSQGTKLRTWRKWSAVADKFVDDFMRLDMKFSDIEKNEVMRCIVEHDKMQPHLPAYDVKAGKSAQRNEQAMVILRASLRTTLLTSKFEELHMLLKPANHIFPDH